MVSFLCLLALMTMLTVIRAAESNPFEPFIGQPAPEIVQLISKETTGSIEVQSFKFLNRTLPDGSRVLIYALMAAPKGNGPYPAVLVCHGGGACADQFRPSIEDWAKRGYVAMCFDEPGIGGRGMKSEGPWDEKKWGVWGFHPNPPENRLFDGVVAGLNAFALLKTQKNVDGERIGITGGSWGGYMTTILSGLLGDKVKAAFAVYGGGFYDKGCAFTGNLLDLPEKDRKRWLEAMDAGAYIEGIKANFFGAYASNDLYWPPSVMQTYNAIPSPKNLVFSPNTSHALSFPGGNVGATPVDQFTHRAMQEVDWMNFYLKKEGAPFPQCHASEAPSRKGNAIEVEFQVEGPAPILSVKVWYSYGNTPWRTRLWQEAVAKRSGDTLYHALIPVEEVNQPIDWFVLASDNRNISASTPMAQLQPLSLGFAASDRQASYFREDFESPVVRRRWHPYYPNDQARKKGDYKFAAEAAHDGANGLLITGLMSLDCFGLRGTSLMEPTVKGIRFWVKSTGSTGFDLEWIDEDAAGRYLSWKNHQNNPGSEWKQITLRWEDFSPAFDSPPHPHFIPTPSLAKLRLLTPEQANLSFDTFETITEDPAR